MSAILDDIIVDRISFLQELVKQSNKPAERQTFQLQINILQNAQTDRIVELIAIRRTDLQTCKSVNEADRIFAELEALEWLQRQVQRLTDA